MVNDDSATSTELSFEQAFTRLERIVRELEEGQLGLSESLSRYEEGVQYLKHCHEALRHAERKIMLLTGLDSEGNPITEPFADEALTLKEKQESRGRRRSRPTSHKSPATDDPAAGKGDADVDNQRGLF